MRFRVLATSTVMIALSIHAADARGLMGSLARGAAFGAGAAIASHAVRSYAADRERRPAPAATATVQQQPQGTVQPAAVTTATPSRKSF